jgi:hypothetical protein
MEMVQFKEPNYMLPDELWILIFSFCENEDLERLKLVNKLFYCLTLKNYLYKIRSYLPKIKGKDLKNAGFWWFDTSNQDGADWVDYQNYYDQIDEDWDQMDQEWDQMDQEWDQMDQEWDQIDDRYDREDVFFCQGVRNVGRMCQSVTNSVSVPISSFMTAAQYFAKYEKK